MRDGVCGESAVSLYQKVLGNDLFLSSEWLNVGMQTWRCPYTTDSDTGQQRKGIGDSKGIERTAQKLEVSKLEREIRRMARTGKRNIIVVAARSEQKEYLLYSRYKSKW